MKNKPFSPVEAMQATQDAHDKAYGVFKADETKVNNKHQELIAEKVAEFETAIDAIYSRVVLAAIFKHHLINTIDTISMIVREEEATEYNKIIDTVLAEKGSYADGYLQGKFDAQMDKELDKTVDNLAL